MAQPNQPNSVILHPKPSPGTVAAATSTHSSPLPPLIQTPVGLALMELQGTINLPITDDDNGGDGNGSTLFNIGRIDFPDYRPDSITFDPASTAWMKQVYLFVGKHQRLTGEVKKLPKALGIVRRRSSSLSQGTGGVQQEEEGELEVMEVVKYKIVFSSRPEPVGTD